MKKTDLQIETLGDASLLVVVGGAADDAVAEQVRALAEAMRARQLDGVMEIVPSYRTIGVHYDPIRAGGQAAVRAWVEGLRIERTTEQRSVREHVLPVLYGGQDGPDLAEVAKHAQLSEEEVIALHTGARYVVRAVGFVPGFGYLAGLPERLKSPRKATPRVRVPAGSVGIAGLQSGVYPLKTPGGWQLIGRTPVKMFRPEEQRASLLEVGDVVRFAAIGAKELREQEAGR